MNQVMIVGSLFTVIISITGCAREPRTAVVEKVEQGGCGPLSGVTTDAIQKCLAERRQLAIEVDQMCIPIRKTATAQWNDSTEGRVCTAARNLALWRSGPVK